MAARHRDRSVAVFGSGASLMDLVRLQDDLEALLGCNVDVVSVGGLKERDEQIRREAVAV